MKKNILCLFISMAIAGLTSSCYEEPDLVLSSIQINQISVLDYPSTDDGENWDFWTSHADIYVTLNVNNGYIYKSEFYDECISSNTYNYEKELPLYLENYSSEHIISLWDYDSTGDDDYMGGFSFTPEDFEGETEITLQNSNSEIIIILTVEWNYKEI